METRQDSRFPLIDKADVTTPQKKEITDKFSAGFLYFPLPKLQYGNIYVCQS